MPNQLFKEPFVGKYDGMTSPVILPLGSVADGLNMRKVSVAGGWKVRKGCVLNNTTAIAAASVLSLHRYVNPRSSDYHFLAQCNSLIYDATNDPPAAGTTFGTSLGVTAGATPGFSAMIGEHWFYADGTSRPIVYSGTSPLPLAFYVYDASSLAYIDFSRVVRDQRTDTEAVVLGAATDKAYLITNEPCYGFVADLGSSVNSNAVDLQIKAWRATAWAAVSSLSDGTQTGGDTTLAQDGTVTWTASASDTMRVIGNSMGYVYEIGWSGALSGSVTIRGLTTKTTPGLLSNKWNGTWDFVTGCRFFNGTTSIYSEKLGDITNVSTSQYLNLVSSTTSDFLYLKTPEPAAGFGFGIASGYGNTESAEIDNIEYWNGNAWTAGAGIIDTTLKSAAETSFSQTGKVFFDAAAVTPIKRTFEGDDLPGYWYRVSWNATTAADVRIFSILYAAFPEPLAACDGVINFKGRLVTWGDKEFPNRLRFSAEDWPDCFCGMDSGWTDSFGEETKILNVLNFYNELLIFKADGIWLLEGYNKATFGSVQIASTIGLASPKSAMVVEVGYPGMNTQEPLSIALWQDVDGIYVLDGRKPKKVSGAIERYFDQEYSECIAAASIANRQAFPDPLKNEYHFLLPDKELVYNYQTDEWYPPWEREIDLVCGISLKGTDGRYYTYGGSAAGLVMRLENDTTDKTTANADKLISHSLKSRAISSSQENSTALSFTLRRVWAELKSRAAGSITAKTFKNMASSGTAQTAPAAMSMIDTGYALATPHVDTNVEGCSCMQVEFSLGVADQEMEIYSMLYEIDPRGRIGG